MRARAAVRADHDVPVEQDDHVLRLLALPRHDVAAFVDVPGAVRGEPRERFLRAPRIARKSAAAKERHDEAGDESKREYHGRPDSH